MQIGGAERVLVDIVNELKDKYDITIFTLYGKGEFESQLDKKIKIINLYNERYDNLSTLKKKLIPFYVLKCGKRIYKKYIKDKYDLEIAFLEGPITRIFSYKSNKNKIVWIHNDISKVFGEGIKAKLKLKIDKKIYRKYDKLVFVSRDNQKSFNNIFNINGIEEKEQVIYNYINKKRILEKSKENIGQEYIDNNIPSIISVCRLVTQKGIDRLIYVHKKLIDEKLNHNIYIIGDGPEKGKLVEKIKQLNVEDTFKLMGSRQNPYPYIKRADYFALLSNYEGYGMVLDEAKILNKNIIITNTAAKEALEGYSNKIILENNEDAIFEGLKQILLKNVVFSDARMDFDNRKVINEIVNLIEGN